jgi:hypothetical protein
MSFGMTTIRGSFFDSVHFRLTLNGAAGNSSALAFLGLDETTPLFTKDPTQGIFAATVDLRHRFTFKKIGRAEFFRRPIFSPEMD